MSRRALRQRLESLELAGVTSLPKRRQQSVEARQAPSRPAAEQPSGLNAQRRSQSCVTRWRPVNSAASWQRDARRLFLVLAQLLHGSAFSVRPRGQMRMPAGSLLWGVPVNC